MLPGLLAALLLALCIVAIYAILGLQSFALVKVLSFVVLNVATILTPLAIAPSCLRTEKSIPTSVL